MSVPFTSAAYGVCAWLLAALSVLHLTSTWRMQAATTSTLVWFFGTGLAMAQAAALNLLNRRYGHAARALRWTTRAVNLVMLAFGAIAGIATGATVGQLATVVGLLAALFLLSFGPRMHRTA